MPKKVPTDCDMFEDNEHMSAIKSAQNDLYRISLPYVGNKRKIVADIADSLVKHEYKFESVLDLFSGSGMVSLFFKRLGKRVISNDLLTSSYFNAVAFVSNTNYSISTEHLKFLCTYDSIRKNDFVRKNYNERFTPEEALFLDNYRSNINDLWDLTPPNDITPFACAIILIEHYVLNHCFLGGRLNNGQVLAKLEHRLQHDRNRTESAAERSDMIFNLEDKKYALPLFGGISGQSINLDCLDALRGSGCVDLAYIDPPYGSDQSDYANMFAFCEEYIYSKKLCDLNHISNAKKFVVKKDYEKHFQEVLDGAKNIPQWAISYNDSSWAEIEKIKEMVKYFKKDVTVVNIDYEYKYRKQADKGKKGPTEYLILAR